MMPNDPLDRNGTRGEISLRDYFRQKNGRLTRHDSAEIIAEILSERDPDRLAAIACHLEQFLARQAQPAETLESLEQAWEQRADHNREARWEIRRLAWEARLQMERRRINIDAEVNPPSGKLTERVCQSIRWDPHIKVLSGLVDYPPLPGNMLSPGQLTQFIPVLECIARAWTTRLEENRPEDESGNWILFRGLENVCRKRQTEQQPTDT